MSDNQKRRIGRFFLNSLHIEKDWKAVLPIMAQIVVVRCELQYWKDGFEYMAFSELFDEVDIGTVPPFYDLIVTYANGGKSFRFERSPIQRDL